jgi:hypothetical protein
MKRSDIDIVDISDQFCSENSINIKHIRCRCTITHDVINGAALLPRFVEHNSTYCVCFIYNQS